MTAGREYESIRMRTTPVIVIVLAALVTGGLAQASGSRSALVVVRDKSVGDVPVGSKPARATSAFGRPDATRRVSRDECRAVWRRIGLTLVYVELSGGNPCRAGVLLVATATSTGWRTDRGLRVGDRAARIHAVYPHARQVSTAPYGGWWLITRHTCPTTGSQAYPGLRARTTAHRVAALIVTVAACE
jgi:hypothetical protein